ncbi:MAG: hypothetical protein K0R25_1184 [Rickettsiaceae bacterium]|jgi:prepilin-type N-terminal cleavage/methylation domain-containing protein|nr:hypothetical protein [Rickettsiaceae bacterium]
MLTAKQKSPPSKKAFSLVELSVTILIIGFLVVGVMAGGSLIKNSQLSSAKSITLSSQITTIPDMVLWVETSLADSFDSNKSIQNAQITNWYNREPSLFLTGNNLTTAASSSITYIGSSINNIPAVKITSPGSISLTNFSGTALASSTIFIVFRPNSDLGSSLTLASSGSGATPSIAIKDTQITINAGLSGTGTTSFTKGGNHILVVNFNGSNSKVFVNNNTEVGGAGAVLNAGTDALDGFKIGGNIAVDVSEVIIYGRTLQSTERQDILRYLAKKYRISVTGV